MNFYHPYPAYNYYPNVITDHYQNPYNHPYFFPYDTYQRNTTPINPHMFMDSAKQTEMLMKDGSLILSKLASSRPLSTDIILAAQNSNKNKVTELIKSTGIKNIPKISYTPNGLTLTFIHEENHIDCCHLILKIRWGDP